MTTLQYVVNAIDGASGTFAKIALSAEDMSKQIDDLAHKSAMATVGLEGDKEFMASVKEMQLQLTRLKAKVTDPEVSLKGLERVFFGIGRADVALDKLGAKHVTATVDVKVNRSGLRGLLSRLGGGGDGGGLLGVGQSGMGSLGLPLAGGGIAGAGLIGAALVPSVAGAGIGGLAGAGLFAGGVFGAEQAKKVLNEDLASIKTITTGLKTAIGQQKKDLSAALKDANKQYTKDAAFFQPFTTFQGALEGLAHTIIAPLRSLMAPLTGIIKNFGKGLTALGPQFTALFKASLPFIDQFLKFMLQAGKILLPAFTEAMLEMVKSGALRQMTQALVILTQGLATFIVNLGPGMNASAVIFARVATFLGRTLGFLGDLFTGIAKVLAFDFPGAVSKGVHAAMDSFGAFRHDVASVGHAIASAWDTLRHDAASTGHDIAHTFDFLRHTLAGTADMIARGLASVWNMIWRNTITRTQNGIHDLIGFFLTVPGRAVGALRGLGHGLAAFASAAMNEMLNGIRRVGSNILGWFGTFVGKIVGFFARLLHHSPTGDFYHMGRNMMEGLAMGLKDHAHLVANASKAAAIAAAGGFADTGARSGSARLAQSFAASVLPRGWSFPALLSLWNQESGWNAYAVNPSSGAYGIPQSLGHGHPYNLGDYKAQIMWGINYIAGRYGSSQAAWQHEMAYNWYDRGGWLPVGASLAYNATGRPERVLGPGEGGGVIFQPGSIVINAPAGNGQQIGQMIAEKYILPYTRNGGHLYPQGRTPR